MAEDPQLGSCNNTAVSYASACQGSNHTWSLELCRHVYKTVCEVKESSTDKPSNAEVWGYGVLFVLVVSLSSVVGVLFLPLMKRDSYQKVLMGMVGLAVGCLCGSAILHLIPQAFKLNGDTDEDLHAYLLKALVVIAAIYAFFLTERLLKLSVDHRKRINRLRKAAIGQDSSLGREVALSMQRHSHNHLEPVGNGETSHLSDDSFDETETKHNCSHMRIPPADVRTHQHEHDLDKKDIKEHPIKTVAWMVITGDGIVDGLSIGAAFSSSIFQGFSISFAVLCEELPHELGDLAILLNSGMSLKRALLYNFLSACTCFLGLVMGICLGAMEEASAWIFALAGGMFLYISLVDMLPEMTHAAEEASGESVVQGLWMLFIQNVGMLSGFAIMFLLAWYKRTLESLFGHQDN